MKPGYKPLVLLAMVMSSCTTSKITSTWKAENLPQRYYNKILVLGLINEPDRTIREKMELNIVSHLQALGYTATCSCDEFGPKSFENLKENEAIAKLNNSGIDAVLTVVLLDKTKERYYVPGHINYSPYGYHDYRFWDYYTTMYDRVYSRGYYATDTRYFWESNFYTLDSSAASTQLLYSAQSQSFDPRSASSLSNEYGKMIIKDMLKAGVIADSSNGKKKLAF